jgi:uncharacterized membrane protein
VLALGADGQPERVPVDAEAQRAPSLDERETLELGRFAVAIEEHYGHHQHLAQPRRAGARSGSSRRGRGRAGPGRLTYLVFRYAHLLGLTLMGAGLIGVWYADLRSRQVRDLAVLTETVRQIAVFYDGLVVPGALLLLGSGSWLTAEIYGGWGFVERPWLAGMVALFAFEFVEGNTITRLYFRRLRRLTRAAFEAGLVTPELERARREHLPTFTHFLDLPILFVIVALGAMRPDTWALFLVGTALAILAATILTLVVPRLYPFEVGARHERR